MSLYDHERYLKEIQEQIIILFYCRLDTQEECCYIRFWDMRPVFDLKPGYL